MNEHRYTPWLSGNCLLLLADDLTAGQREDALNLQLFAWLKAGESGSAFEDDAAWQAEYNEAQLRLGWPPSYSERKEGCQLLSAAQGPLQVLLAPLKSKLPQSRHAALDACIAGVQALPDGHPALQAWRAEAVQDPAEGDVVSRLSFEIRLVQPVGQRVAASLYLATREPLRQRWLDQPLALDSLERVRFDLSCAEVHEATFAGVRGELQQLLREGRLAYTTPVQAREVVHE